MKTIEWQFLVAAGLFLSGLSAGLMFASAVASWRAGGERVARTAAMLAPWPVLAGIGCLGLDLGRVFSAYKLFLHFRWQSPMSVGSWLLLAFSILCLLHLAAWLPAERRRGLFAAVPRRLRFLHALDRDLSEWRRPLAMAGVPLSIAVAMYTGVLLGAMAARPLWNSALVAQLFLLSSFSAGAAVLILAVRAEARELRWLVVLDGSLLALELVAVLMFLLHGRLSLGPVRHAMELLLGGPYALLFWVCFVGLGVTVPLAMAVRELKPAAPHNRALTTAAAVLVIGGGFLLRCILIFAGQASAVE